jgi:hypothetical protein
MLRRVCLVLIAFVFVACAPERPDVAPTDGAYGTAGMAALVSDGMGSWDISVMDRHGNELDRIDANLSNPVGISHHPDDYFLVGQGSSLLRVEADGSREVFNNEPLQSGYLYRTSVAEDGSVTVSEEYDSTELDEDGDVILYNQGTTEFCWMDATVSSLDTGDTVLLDIFGPTLAAWDTSTNAWDYFVTVPGAEANIVGVDRSGDYWLASSWRDDLWLATADGTSERIGRLADMGVNAWGIHAVEPAGSDSVYALYEGSVGSGIVEVDASGRATEVAISEGEVWLDLVVY